MRTIISMLILGAGCAPVEDPIALACGGARPALTDCTFGVYHGDCGGTGEATFACDDVSGACRWFATGCVPAGHHASDCPAGDLCCHMSPDGAWPFADGWALAEVHARVEQLDDIAIIGGAVVGE